MSKVALLILFNHNYEASLGRLETIYKGKFEHLYFIMPFYTGSRKDVITVYENSYYFHGYIAKALEQIKSQQFDHYIIIGDDLLLNPAIDQTNYKEHFKVDGDTGFIPGPFLLNDPYTVKPFRKYPPYWSWTRKAADFKIDAKGIEVKKFLPSYEEALQLLKRHDIHFTPELPAKMFYGKNTWKFFRDEKAFLAGVRHYLNVPAHVNRRMSYPLIGSYADIVVVPGEHVDNMIKYCGIFSALHLFVEIALPTALAFSVPTLSTEEKLPLKGETYWENTTVESFQSRYQNNLANLVTNFPPNSLYIHPVKLSKWK